MHHAELLLRVALDNGINFIDTSPYYGRTLSEKVLGKAFKEIPREKFIIGTKCGRYDVSAFDFSAERVTRSVDESLQRMGLEASARMTTDNDTSQAIQEELNALVKKREGIKLLVSGFPIEQGLQSASPQELIA